MATTSVSPEGWASATFCYVAQDHCPIALRRTETLSFDRLIVGKLQLEEMLTQEVRFVPRWRKLRSMYISVVVFLIHIYMYIHMSGAL